ncbi:glycosyltransferase [Candidatus Woesebacteria bacterium]|nr:glycosyltransferase [Candidatus Woesebacteria bacterium]
MQHSAQNNKISVVTGTYNRLPYLKLTIDSIRKELKNLNYEIIVVDGGSTDGTPQWLAKQKDILTIIQHNRGAWKGTPIQRRSWGYFMNLGFKAAEGTYICMLSDDCLIVPGAIKNGYELFEQKLTAHEKIGAIAFYWRNWPEETAYRVGLTLGGKMFVNHGLYLKSALSEVGYIDEETFSFYHADGDLCLKLWQQGYECIESPDSYIEHHSHANTAVRKSNSTQQQDDWQKYLKKWTGIFYDGTTSNTGTDIKKDFTDTAMTAAQFKKAGYFNYFIRIKLKHTIKQWIR